MFKKDLKLWAFFAPIFEKLSARLVLIVMVISILVSSCGDLKQGSEIVEPTSIPTLMPTKELTLTPTPIPSETLEPTSTQVPTETATPTAIPTPVRELTYEEFELFMEVLGVKLLKSGCQYFDRYTVFSGFQGYPYRPVPEDYSAFLAEFEIQMRAEYERNNNADYWSRWAVECWVNQFGSLPNSGYRGSDWRRINEVLGNPDIEPYVSGFDYEFVGLDSEQYYTSRTYNEKMRKAYGLTKPEVVALDDVDLDEWERLYLINWYFLPMSGKITKDHFISMTVDLGGYQFVYPWEGSWSQEELDGIRNIDMCIIVANDIAYALKVFKSYQGDMYGKYWYEALVEAREFASEDLVNICPDFLSYVRGPYRPHPSTLPPD